MNDLDPKTLNYDDRGLLPVVSQDEATGAVLMLAWADREAVAKTLETGEAHSGRGISEPTVFPFVHRSREAASAMSATSAP